MEYDMPFILGVLTLVAGTGATWGVLLFKVKHLDKTVAEHVEEDHELQLTLTDRLARIETKLDRVLRDARQ